MLRHLCFFFSSRRRHTRWTGDWSSDVCSSDLPNRFEPGRATIVVYNWPLLAAVAVNLSGVLQIGDRYELRNVQDYFGAPLLSGTFGGTLSVPMTGVAPPAIIGGSPNPPQQTGPAFDVFIVQKVTP